MNRSLAIFLQGVIVTLGISVFALMLWEPNLEGRNAHATLFQIYFNDPFLAYGYVASVPFFVALYQACKLLGYAGQSKTFSQAAVKSLRTIKYCAFMTAAAIVAADAYIKTAARGNDDPAGAIMLGIVATFTFIVIGTTAAIVERVLQNAVDLKSKNDLTVRQNQQSNHY